MPTTSNAAAAARVARVRIQREESKRFTAWSVPRPRRSGPPRHPWQDFRWRLVCRLGDFTTAHNFTDEFPEPPSLAAMLTVDAGMAEAPRAAYERGYRLCRLSWRIFVPGERRRLRPSPRHLVGS